MLGKIASVNEPQGSEPYADVMSVDQVSSSLKEYIPLIDKYYGRTQRRSFYEVIQVFLNGD